MHARSRSANVTSSARPGSPDAHEVRRHLMNPALFRSHGYLIDHGCVVGRVFEQTSPGQGTDRKA